MVDGTSSRRATFNTQHVAINRFQQHRIPAPFSSLPPVPTKNQEPRTKNGSPTKNEEPRTGNGFTIIELLGVLLVLAGLATLLVSVVGLVHRTVQRHRAETEANALVQAVLHYQQTYGAWPCAEAHSNTVLFVAGVGASNNALFATAGSSYSLTSADVDQSSILAALAPDSAGNPRRIPFLSVATNALRQGRLVDPWGHPYLLVMDAQQVIFQIGDLVFSNLPAFAISAGAPVANPTVTNWIFSAGVRP